MEILVWIGGALTLAGLCGVLWSLVAVMRARRTETDDAALRARLARILPVNLGALGVSVIGLLLVMLGIFFG